MQPIDYILIVSVWLLPVGTLISAIYLRARGKRGLFKDVNESVRGCTEDAFWGHTTGFGVLLLGIAFGSEFVTKTSIIFLCLWTLFTVGLQTYRIGRLDDTCQKCLAEFE